MGHPAHPHHQPHPNAKVAVLLPPSEASAQPYERLILRADDFAYVPVADEHGHLAGGPPILRVTENGVKVAEFEATLGAYLLDNHQGG